MAITASRTSLGRDLEVGREAAASRGRSSLMRRGLRQAKKEKDFDKALRFNDALASEGKAYGMTGSATDTSSIAQGRVASRDALTSQMRSQMPALAGRTREGNIAAAKSAGTFDASREKFNLANSGKKTMDEAGNIMDAPATSTPSASTTSNAPSAQDITRERFGGGGTTPSFTSMTQDRFGGGGTTPSVADQTKDRFSGSTSTTQEPLPVLPDTADTSQAVDKNSSTRKAAAKELTNKTPKSIDGPPSPAEVAAAEIGPAAKLAGGPSTRDVDPLFTDKRGLGAPDKTNPANYDFRVNPGASELPYIAGRGSDIGSRLLQALNPMQLKQGGKSDLPPMMGEQPEYANANDRLKGDAEVIKAASDAGQIKARRVVDQYGKTNIEVLTPTMRDTGEAVRPWLKKDEAKPVAARAKGGPVKAGKPYLVGEEGPEIVVPDEDGEVLPNDKIRKKSRKELQKMLSKR